MFTVEDIKEYKEDLQNRYNARAKGTYMEVEAVFNFLMLERIEMINGLGHGELTEEQFDEIDDFIGTLVEENEQLVQVKRKEWAHSSDSSFLVKGAA